MDQFFEVATWVLMCYCALSLIGVVVFIISTFFFIRGWRRMNSGFQSSHRNIGKK